MFQRFSGISRRIERDSHKDFAGDCHIAGRNCVCCYRYIVRLPSAESVAAVQRRSCGKGISDCLSCRHFNNNIVTFISRKSDCIFFSLLFRIFCHFSFFTIFSFSCTEKFSTGIHNCYECLLKRCLSRIHGFFKCRLCFRLFCRCFFRTDCFFRKRSFLCRRFICCLRCRFRCLFRHRLRCHFLLRFRCNFRYRFRFLFLCRRFQLKDRSKRIIIEKLEIFCLDLRCFFCLKNLIVFYPVIEFIAGIRPCPYSDQL